MHNFRKLQIWQEAMDMAVDIYQLVKKLPNDEKFGMTSQMRRAAVSVPSNIAEGAGRGTNKDFVQFLNIAIGSCFELETQLLLSVMVGYLDENKVDQIVERLRLLEGKIHNFRARLLKDN